MNQQNAYQNYRYILGRLKKGIKWNWDKMASVLPTFPNGVDGVAGRKWIINAIDCGSMEAIKWMLSKNIDVVFVDKEGYSVLHACMDREASDKYKIMQLLIDYHADINIGAKVEQMALNSWSPLHMAAVRNDLKAIEILLKNGADRNLITCVDDYCNAEEEARYYGNIAAADLIRNFERK